MDEARLVEDVAFLRRHARAGGDLIGLARDRGHLMAAAGEFGQAESADASRKALKRRRRPESTP
jgi:hypothetical protein